jgi:hypothetical protein
MKIAKFVPFAVAVVLGASINTARAAHVWEDPNGWWDTHWVYGPADVPKFTAQELSLDLFGTFTSDESQFSHLFQHDIRDGVWGGGVGLNYFITREIGIGGDLNMPDDGGKLVDAMAANVIARFPIESAGLAPYVFGGATRLTQPDWEWAGQFGVGLEVRFNPVTGIFIDGRYMWPENITDLLELRAGLRLVF